MLLLLDGQIPHKPGMATVLGQHCRLLKAGKQPKPAHINNLGSTTDNCERREAAFPPPAKARGFHAANLMNHLVHTLRSQGRFCGASGSAMYDELFELVAKDVEAGGVFATILSGHEDDSARQAVPLRLLGGLHRLALDGRAPTLRRFYPSTGGTWDAAAAWPEIMLTARDRGDELRAALDQPPQTNEVGRSAVLIGGLLFLARQFDLPVRLFEIGTSAGLNLRAEHYRYGYPGGQWGPLDSPVTIDDAWRGELPPDGGGAHRRTARIRHRTHRRHRHRRGNDGAELRVARPERPAGAAARRNRGGAHRSRSATPREGCRRGRRHDPCRR